MSGHTDTPDDAPAAETTASAGLDSGGARPALLCYDGSEGSKRAITESAALLCPRAAVVLTVWEPVAIWEPYDPAAILSAGVARLGSHALALDEIARGVARDEMERGVALARAAGFDATGRTAHGKTWQAICGTAAELDAAPIVVGARGLSRIAAALGSVSAAVVTHAHRPVLVVAHHD